MAQAKDGSLMDWLKSGDLQDLHESILKNGGSKLEDIQQLSSKELELLCDECKFPILKRKKFINAVGLLNKNGYQKEFESSLTCPVCKGKGHYDKYAYCNNNGIGQCSCCHGHGKIDNAKKQCTQCKGRGHVNQYSNYCHIYENPINTCALCKGECYMYELPDMKLCPVCSGKGYYSEYSYDIAYHTNKNHTGKCTCCNGNAQILKDQKACSSCKGKGYVNQYNNFCHIYEKPTNPCALCNGKCYV